MRSNQIFISLLLMSSTVLVGCQSSRLGALNTQPTINRPAPLPAAPSGTVTQGTLDSATGFPDAPDSPTPPPSTEVPENKQDTDEDQGETQIASTTGGTVTREQMVGAWRVSTAGSSCQIFMALTKWSGGFRAASRGCPGAAANITAWNVANNQVQLKDSGGNTIATLLPNGPSRYSGSAGGSTIILSR